MPNQIDYALHAAFRLVEITGWFIFPCNEFKKPLTPHGYKDATDDLVLITRWWTDYPGALVGIACEKSGLFVLDVDCKGGVDGLQSLHDLVRTRGEGRYPMVGPMQRTPSGGWHLFFKLPETVRIPNNAGKLGPGLDLRSAGYVCTGRGYRWAQDHGPDREVTEAPAWLLNAIREMGSPKVEYKPPVKVAAAGVGRYWLEYYLKRTREGRRNGDCFFLGLQLRDHDVSLTEAEQLGEEFASRAPGMGFGPLEAVRAIRSAFSTEKRPAILGADL